MPFDVKMSGTGDGLLGRREAVEAAVLCAGEKCQLRSGRDEHSYIATRKTFPNKMVCLGSDRSFAALSMKIRCGPTPAPQQICVKLATWAGEVLRMIE